MDKISGKILIFNPKYLSIHHQCFEWKSSPQISKSKQIIKDISEQRLLEFISDTNKFKIDSKFDHENIMNFLYTKFEAMEKLDLNDELIDDIVENKKIKSNKKIFQKSQPKNSYKNFKSDKTVHIQKHEKLHHDNSTKKSVQLESGKSQKHFLNSNFGHHHEKHSHHKHKAKNDLFEKMKTTLDKDSNKKNNDSKKRDFTHFFSSKELIYSILQEMDKNHCK